MKVVKITVKKDKRVEVTGEGFKGTQCDLMRRLAEKIGQVTSDEATSEAFLLEQEDNSQSCSA
jgi:hypothetical protein